MAHLILWNTLDSVKNTLVRPLGIHQLASWLIHNGYDVKVIDFCSHMPTYELVSITNKFITDETIGIGISTTFWIKNSQVKHEPQWVLNARTLLELKHKNLNWILGGSGISYDGINFSKQWIKFSGFGEDSLLNFLDEKSSSSKIRIPFNIQNNFGHYHSPGLNISSSEVLPLELSRGCQFKCRFCRYGELGKKKNTYIRDYKLIEEELIYNYETFGVTRYALMDDTVNESIEKIEAMADIAQRLPFKLEWIGYLRLDLIGNKPHTAELLVESGLRGCFFGIESFHPKASTIVGKGWNGKHGKDFLLKLKDQWGNRVKFNLGLIVGLHGETEKDVDNTQKWCIDNKIHSWSWTPLDINTRTANTLWKSEFDINHEKYGYRFPNKSNIWVNEDWDFIKARSKSFDLNKDVSMREHVSPWRASFFGILGYSFDELYKLKEHELNQIELKEKTKIRLKEYIAHQKSYN